MTDDMSHLVASGSKHHPPVERKKRKRSRKVCTTCRQAKAKCDAADRFPDSCTRCVQNSTQCTIDPSFKRARRRVQVSAKLNGSDSSESGGERSNGNYVLGNVGLSTIQATTLFNIFFDRYHPFCPLFLHRLEPSNTYVSDPFLFWAIVAVAGRASLFDTAVEAIYPRKELLSALGEVKKLAMAQNEHAGRFLGVVQALILLAEWGFPSVRQRDDRSWLFINLAIQQGYMMGFHRPFHSFEYSSRAEDQAAAHSVEGKEKTIAWIHCHIISHILASDLGVPSMIQDDWVATQAAAACGKPDRPMWLMDVPASTLQMLAIARLINKSATIMGNSPHSPTGQIDGLVAKPAWDGLNQELTDLEGRIVSLEPHVASQLVLTRMRLHALCLQSAMSVQDRTEMGAQLFSSCIRSIQLASQNDPGTWLYWPRTASRGIFMAAIVLTRLIGSVDGVGYSLAPGLAATSSAYRLLMRTCYLEDDRRRRDAQILLVAGRDAQFRRTERRLYGGNAPGDRPEVKSRMGVANYLHDCLAASKRAVDSHTTTRPYLEGTADMIGLEPNVNGDWMGGGETMAPMAPMQIPANLPPVSSTLGDWAAQYLGKAQGTGFEPAELDVILSEWTRDPRTGFMPT